MTDRYPCPCCGYRTLDEPPGSYEICRVCFWEDDLVQLRWPTYAGGANKPSLAEAQQAFAAMGAKQERVLHLVRPPAADEIRDPGWRPVTNEDDFEPLTDERADWPADRTALYWWRPTFWRRQPTR
jgi:Cysteine-rich CPCC